MHKDAAAVRLALEGPDFALVEDWRRSQPKIPSRNEAIRLLLRRALERSSEKSEAAVAESDGAAEFGSSKGRRERLGPR
jgi:hypothetical protein